MENEQSIKGENEISEQNETSTQKAPKPKMKQKHKAIIVLVSLVALLVILIPILLLVNNCAEKKIEQAALKDAILCSVGRLDERYGGSKEFLFEAEPVKVYYSNEDAKFYEQKKISAISIRAYDQDGVSYICTVYFYGDEPASWGFDNYVE